MIQNSFLINQVEILQVYYTAIFYFITYFYDLLKYIVQLLDNNSSDLWHNDYKTRSLVSSLES